MDLLSTAEQRLACLEVVEPKIVRPCILLNVAALVSAHGIGAHLDAG
jgi:hypothetical protein